MEDLWETKASNVLKAELIRRSITYDDLQKRLAKIGLELKTKVLITKINRGTFSFTFFLRVMTVIEAKNIELV